MSKLTIIDETRAELAELGIETVVKVERRLCRDCRFEEDGCIVNARESCVVSNPYGLCTSFEKRRINGFTLGLILGLGVGSFCMLIMSLM